MTHDTEHRGNPLSEELIKQIRRLYREGVPIRKIQRVTGVAKATVEKYVKGLPPHRPARPPRPPRRTKACAELLDEEIPSGDDEAHVDRLLTDYDPDPAADQDWHGDFGGLRSMGG